MAQNWHILRPASSGRGKVGNAAIRKTSCLLGRLGVLSSTESAVAWIFDQWMGCWIFLVENHGDF